MKARGLLDALWPRTCAVEECGARVDLPEGHLCSRCRASLPWHDDRDDAALAYLDPVPALVRVFKYGGGTHLAGTFAAVMEEALRRKTDVAALDAVVPVPLHPLRLKERGYNQSELLAEALARAIGRQCIPDALVRKRDTEHQARLAGDERRKNLQGAFSADRPERVRGRMLLLVDDVATTGSTLAACTEALVRAGAFRVVPFVFARALMDD
ncbi:MAG: ComF family protein [Kiritimatiellae bacterium]|nr:ComF family protein [Kiritimatiellia bacterium]